MKYTLVIMLSLLAIVACSKTEEETATVSEPAVEEIVRDEATILEAGKQIAEKYCAACHGKDGVEVKWGMPFLSGLNKTYISTSLQGYIKGKRDISVSNAVTDKLIVINTLENDQINDVATYYASLATPWQGQQFSVLDEEPTVTLSPKNVRAGAKLAPQCDSCHGEGGNSKRYKGAPSLAAMPPEYFIASLKAYFYYGNRKDDAMNVYDQWETLNQQGMTQLAAYYAVQIPQRVAKSTQGNAKRGAVLAKQCGGCHGLDGNTIHPAAPSLAGQPFEYLVSSMKDYQEGRRKHQAMELALKGMNESNIIDLAAFYGLQQPLPLYRWVTQSSGQFRPIEDGARIARMCDSCHGKNGNSTTAGTPTLAGLSARYLSLATRAYRDGVWKHNKMHEMVSFLEDFDIEKVSIFYSLQEPVTRKQEVKFDRTNGELISPACTICHGKEAIKKDPSIPSLNGQDYIYLVNATRAYAKGQREHKEMQLIAEVLIEQDENNLSDVLGYFSKQAPIKADTVIPDTSLNMLEKCHSCHDENGMVSTSTVPRLAGQSEAYLLQAMKGYQSGKRIHKDMNEITRNLTLMEIHGIADYFAGQ